ncbi:hypothetical protein K457DRAFT_13716 [Linnemannia elongata AG-77]|uniref:Galactose oxidase n=1 Tax=Linnemannia elongata AG-77 TaxID=1314771 RepID=A0A197KDB6_9FUNG|nr:hypothetical protein K457DRAFT_13716 [Linnemannia elongata AG-77]
MAAIRSGNYFYIQGGLLISNNGTRSDPQAQLLSLDLSRAWNTSSPSWTDLAGGVAESMISGVSLLDNKTLITFLTNNTGSFYYKRYDVTNNTWGSLYPIEVTKGENLKSSRAILDPSDGGVKTLGMTPIAEGMFKSRLYAGAVYHPQRKSILYFGGFQQGVVFEKTAYITEFVIGTGVWSVITTSGTSPPPLANHCMAQSEDGNTMVVYGGRVPAEYTPTTTTTSFTYSGVLYLFNIPTLSWSKVSDSKPRFNIACTIIGNHNPTGETFNATDSGGVSGNGASATNKPSNGSGEESNNKPVILGGSLGGLLVALMGGMFYFYRKGKIDKERASILEKTTVEAAATAALNPPIRLDPHYYVEPHTASARNPHMLDRRLPDDVVLQIQMAHLQQQQQGGGGIMMMYQNPHAFVPMQEGIYFHDNGRDPQCPEGVGMRLSTIELHPHAVSPSDYSQMGSSSHSLY